MNTVNVGQELFNSLLPKEYRDYNYNFHDKSTIPTLLTRMGKELPADEYATVLRDIFKLGADVTYYEGSSFSLDDLRVPERTGAARQELQNEVYQILSDNSLSREDKNKKVISLVQDSIKPLQKMMMQDATRNQSGLARQVESGARGKLGDLQSLLLGDMIMEDSKGNAIPIPLLHGYAQGVDPAEYFSNSFGTRLGVLSTKKATADAGYLCLSGLTSLCRADGSVTFIDRIKVGDIVNGSDRDGNISDVEVTATFKNGVRETRSYVFRSLKHGDRISTIRATKEHKVLNAFGEIRPIGETYAIKSWGNDGDVLILTAISEPLQEETFDIEVDNKDHLFVLANGAIVSNSKRIKQVSHRQVVTESDCGTQRSIEVDTKDPDNIGALLAVDTEGYEAGTPIDANMLKKLKTPSLQVRSPITCDAQDGLCAHCSGIREKGQLPDIGENLGVIAGQSVGERSTQAALCLHKGTMVRMADLSIKPIEDIEVGDYVIGSTPSGELRPSKVLNTFDQGHQEVYEYVYKKGQSKDYVTLESTKNHVVLSNTQKSMCKEEIFNDTVRPLVAGYKCSQTFAVLQQSVYEPPGAINEPLAMAAGLLYGDGCRSESTPILSCADPSQMEDLDVELEKVGMHSVKRQRKYDWALSLKSPEGTTKRGSDGRFVFGEEKGSRNPLIKLQSRLDTRLKYCHEKSLAEEILLTWDTNSVCRLIAGYFAADGSIYRDKSSHVYVTFGSTSRRLLEGFKFLLDTRLGLHSSKIYKYVKNDKNHRDFYELKLNRLTEVQRFNELVGPLVPGVKRDRMSQYVSEATYKRAKQFFRAKRVQENFLGVLPCFDIEVDHPDHLFLLANGMTVSNSKKHSAGRATGEKKDKFISGYDLIEQLMSVPKHYPDAAAMSDLDGTVESIEEAAQGGYNVVVNGQKHHVPPRMDVTVKVGDEVEAGDLLSEGLPDPAKLVKYRGLGEARRIFNDQLRTATNANRRNTEIVTKAFLDYIKIKDPDLFPNSAPDDIIKYSELAKKWTPREGTTKMDPNAAVGRYLETAVSQYTIGTRISRRVARDLEKKGYNQIDANSEAPPFEPIVIPSSRALTNADDWQERMGGYYLKQSLLDSASRGMESKLHSTSYYPGIMKGTDFGTDVGETGKY